MLAAVLLTVDELDSQGCQSTGLLSELILAGFLLVACEFGVYVLFICVTG